MTHLLCGKTVSPTQTLVEHTWEGFEYLDAKSLSFSGAVKGRHGKHHAQFSDVLEGGMTPTEDHAAMR